MNKQVDAAVSVQYEEIQEVPATGAPISMARVSEFQDLIDAMQQCCQERSVYVSERFGLPQAELRCLLMAGEQRYVTAGELARRMNVAKSRVTRIVDGLLKKKLVQKFKDPSDSRVTLLCLTPEGQRLRTEADAFLQEVARLVLSQLDPADQEEVMHAVRTLKGCMQKVKEMII